MTEPVSEGGSSEMAPPRDSAERLVGALIVVAFVLRLALRLSRGEQRFLQGGSGSYLEIARTFLGGGGLCVYRGHACALLMPGYPLLIAPLMTIGRLYPGLVIIQSALGAALVWVAWEIGCEVFDHRVGLVAATLTAFDPYAVIHDTALQETVVFNAMMGIGVLLLLQSRRSTSGAASFGAGLALALGQLTTARTMLFLPGALMWSALTAGPSRAVRLRHTALVALPLMLLIGGWTIRNWRVVGAPVLTTTTGQYLWAANNAVTLFYLPTRSMDVSISESFDRLTFDAQEALRRLDGQDVAQDRVFGRWGRQYVVAHPGQTVWNAVRKVWSPMSGQLSPVQGRVESLGYALFFVPVHILAAIGLWRSRGRASAHALVYVMLLTFGISTAIFWAHTSHKSYLDPFLFVYAASILVALFDTLRPLDSLRRFAA